MLPLAVIFFTLLLDQASKYWVLHIFDLPTRQIYEVTPFFDLVMAWNTGISYGLFPQESEIGQWVLIGIKAAAIVFFVIWMCRAENPYISLSLALIIGGAAGNGIDRLLYGAVVDFISLHAASYRWYIFNVADIAIVCGVACLLYDAVRPRSATASP